MYLLYFKFKILKLKWVLIFKFLFTFKAELPYIFLIM